MWYVGRRSSERIITDSNASPLISFWIPLESAPVGPDTDLLCKAMIEISFAYAVDRAHIKSRPENIGTSHLPGNKTTFKYGPYIE
jgi:hypothetical protein